MSIVVIGAIFVDIKGFSEYQYLPEGRNKGHIQYIHGGVARNVVENIANIELRPTFVSLVNTEAVGQDVIRRLKQHKVNTDYIRTVPNGSGTWLAVFDENGDLAGSISERPDLMPIYDILKEHGDELFQNCTSVVLEADIDRDIANLVFHLARKYNKKVFSIVSNMAIALRRRDLIKNFDCFVCNDIEAGQLFQKDYSSMSVEDMMEELRKDVEAAEIKAMVVTLGARGSIFTDNTGKVGYMPADKAELKDTTGAGDAFCSGLVIG
ncbi:MAG: carbohydrate kinase family protein, partial [Erysipelotrichaceae bacterium]|nr:carbohydrate kinase family protein [Erysipelotrichaceae bacterium]